MHTICWSPKGGSGTTVVAATIALAAPRPTLLIDLAGDLAACLGAAEPPTGDGRGGAGHDGILDWLRSDAIPERLDDLAQPIEDGLDLIRRGAADGAPVEESRWGVLAQHLTDRDGDTVVDIGTLSTEQRPPDALWRSADRRLMVIRPCYLGLRLASRSRAVLDGRSGGPGIDGVIVVDEPGRALGAADIERCIGAPVVAATMLDPNVARAVDAGLLLTRRPRSLQPIAALAR